MELISIELTGEELDIIGLWLMKLPYEQSAPLIGKLQKVRQDHLSKQSPVAEAVVDGDLTPVNTEEKEESTAE